MEADLRELIGVTEKAVLESKDMIAEARARINLTEKTVKASRKLLEPEKPIWTPYLLRDH